VQHLVCLVSMVASHLDFRKPPQSARSPSLTELAQNQVEKLFHGIFTAKHLHHFGSPLHLLSEPVQLIGSVEVAAIGLG